MTQVLVPLLSGAPPRAPAGPVLRLDGETMGTTWSVQAAADRPLDAEALRAAVQARLDALVGEMSPWRPDSDLSRFNAAPAGAWIALPDDFIRVLRCALAVAEATGGAFDPTLGRLTDLWGFGPSPWAGAAPTDAMLAGPRGWERVVIDAAGRVFQPGGLTLDLNGVAKGFAVDAVAGLLQERGLPSFLVEIGGELRGQGVQPDGQPWWVEVEAPPGAGDGRCMAALYGLSVATSGAWRRAWEADGRVYAHTLDPATGRPLETPPLSVTVLAETCMRADALATALTVLGLERGLAFADEHDVAVLFAVREDEAVAQRPSAAWAELLQ